MNRPDTVHRRARMVRTRFSLDGRLFFDDYETELLLFSYITEALDFDGYEDWRIPRP